MKTVIQAAQVEPNQFFTSLLRALTLPVRSRYGWLVGAAGTGLSCVGCRGQIWIQKSLHERVQFKNCKICIEKLMFTQILPLLVHCRGWQSWRLMPFWTVAGKTSLALLCTHTHTYTHAHTHIHNTYNTRIRLSLAHRAATTTTAAGTAVAANACNRHLLVVDWPRHLGKPSYHSTGHGLDAPLAVLRVLALRGHKCRWELVLFQCAAGKRPHPEVECKVAESRSDVRVLLPAEGNEWVET